MPESPHAPKSPRLLDRVRATIRTRHYSRRTEEAYVAWICRFILFHGKRHPSELGEPAIRDFATALAVRDRVSASTQNQALSAILLPYRDVLGVEIAWVHDIAHAPARVRAPVVLSRDEARSIISCVRGTPRLVAALLYGSGLRLLKCQRLRVKDVDFSRHEITVRGGKGDKDRVTMLPASIASDLGAHIAAVARRHAADLAAGAGWVEMPHALSRK